jgi:dihydropteroate synthase
VSGAYRLMGVVNVTPDSFSDGGLYLSAEAALAHALELIDEGADIVDIGGESTRPGAEPVSEADERERVLAVIEALAERDTGAQISIDSSKAGVARAALAAGASLVNDVSAFRVEPEIAAIVAEHGADCCLMHMRGAPRTMQRGGGPRYEDVVDEVRSFLEQRMEFAIAAGVAEQRIMLDPGIGFGKTVADNLRLLEGLPRLVELGRPVLVGTSRKSFLGRIVADARGLAEPVDVDQRLAGTLATNVIALERGASVFRVHEVGPVRDALTVAAATFAQRWKPSAPAKIPTT